MKKKAPPHRAVNGPLRAVQAERKRLKRSAPFDFHLVLGDVAVRFHEGWKEVVIQGRGVAQTGDEHVMLLNLSVPLDVLDQFVVALARVRAFVREGAQL